MPTLRDAGPARGVHEPLQPLLPPLPAETLAEALVQVGPVNGEPRPPRRTPIGLGSVFRHNVRMAGGPAPVRAYIDELLPTILDGSVEPGRVFDAVTDLAGVPAGYRDRDERRSLEVLVRS